MHVLSVIMHCAWNHEIILRTLYDHPQAMEFWLFLWGDIQADQIQDVSTDHSCTVKAFTVEL